MMKKALIMLSASLLFACGGGGGSSSSLPPERPDGAMSGIAHDNILIGSDINVYSLGGELLGTGETDNQGRYSVDLNSVESQIVLVEATNGQYTEEFSGEVVELEEGDRLRAYVYYDQGGAVDLSVTLLSTISAGYAEYLMGLGVSASDAVSRANGSVSDMVGLDIEAVHPVDITDLKNARPSLDQQLKYSFITAAVSPLMAWVSEENDADIHIPFNSIMFAQTAYEDIRHDGRLDGQGTSGVLAFGTVPVNTEMYRNQLAINMLVMANNTNNATDIDAGDLLSFAEEYNSSNHPAFGAEQAPPAPLSAIAPNVTNFSWEAGETLAATVSLSFDVADRIGMDSVTLTINGTDFVAGDPDSPVFSVDTTPFADGLYSATIVAKSVTGGTTTLSRDLTIANAGISISDVRPQDGEYIRGSYPFSATVTDPIAVNDVLFTINSNIMYSPASLTSPVENIDTTETIITEGAHTFKVWAENQAGYTAEISNTFYLDNTNPVISWGLQNGTYIDSSFSISATISDNLKIKSVKLLLDGEVVEDNAEVDFSNVFSLSHTFTRSAMTEGQHTVAIEVEDMAGNTSQASRTFNVDNYAPTLNITTGAGVVSGSYVLSWSANDSVGIVSQKVYVNGSLYTTLNGSARSANINTSGSEGNKTISVQVFDASGKSASDSVSKNYQHIPVTYGSPTYGTKRFLTSGSFVGQQMETLTYNLSNVSGGERLTITSVSMTKKFGNGTSSFDSLVRAHTTYSNGVLVVAVPDECYAQYNRDDYHYSGTNASVSLTITDQYGLSRNLSVPLSGGTRYWGCYDND